ncbi:MAG: secondary thiamine-phosphate synthase enzyme YjbQ [Candidatus Omnitrophica bacterium]|nr:secondary thiamine-phosphate synthase enzyme YjbQ [Candidatus Omnitrophota bacterium]
MKIVTEKIKLKTTGNPDLINITEKVSEILTRSQLKNGIATVFVVGSTAAITTFEFEPGLIKDVQDLLEKLISEKGSYAHDLTWNDANGFSHLRAMLLGPSLVVPFEEGRLLLGTWQQVVLAEFDCRSRSRTIVVQLIGIS